MNFDEQARRERKGADGGLNPMFGEWQQRFNFSPVPYGSGAAQRGEFRNAVQAELNNNWLYSNEIHIDITLYVDVQTTLETDKNADLDNYCKSILDALKGPNGIMIDDTQVQALSIHWLDCYGSPYFTVSAKGSADEFLLKPQEFYEMPDGLWYPHGRFLWSEGGSLRCSDTNHFAGLTIMEHMSSIKRRARAAYRKAGSDRLRAYQFGQYFSSTARGFHRGRVEDFVLHRLPEWRAEKEQWQSQNPDAFSKIEKTLGELRQRQDEFVVGTANLGTKAKDATP
jgi:hypothetical protein